MSRRRRHLVTIVLAGLACAAAPIGAIAGAPSHHSRMVICPLGAHADQCCGPPMVGPSGSIPCCARSTTACPARMTIATAPNPSVSGRRVTITGAAPAEGDQVILWERLPGRQTFRRVASTTAGTSGSYTFVLRPTTNLALYAAWGTLPSRTVTQSVDAAVTLRALAAPVGRSVSIAFAGLVSPSHNGQRIALQRRFVRGWRTVAYLRMHSAHDHASRFGRQLIVRRGRHRARFRALLRGDARNVTSASRAVVIGGVD